VLNLCGDADSFCTVEGFWGVFSLSASAWRVGDRMALIGAGVMKMSTSVVLSAFNQSLLAILLVGSTWDMKGELDGSLFVSLCTVSREAGESMLSTRYDMSLVVASRRRMRIWIDGIQKDMQTKYQMPKRGRSAHNLGSHLPAVATTRFNKHAGHPSGCPADGLCKPI
jgi:hypothetical protein